MNILVDEDDQRRLLDERHHLRQQRDGLQADNTRLELENRDLRAIVRRLRDLPPMTGKEQHQFEQKDEQQKAEFFADELRRSHLWMRLRGTFGVIE